MKKDVVRFRQEPRTHIYMDLSYTDRQSTVLNKSQNHQSYILFFELMDRVTIRVGQQDREMEKTKLLDIE